MPTALSQIIRLRLRRFGFGTRFTGTWDDRLSGLFDCGVAYEGKRILDVGSNMGVIAYEISKRRPAFLHGIDHYRRAVTISRRIFLAVDTPHRFDVVDFLDTRKIIAKLEPGYDIVLLLAVWQHIRKADLAASERFVAALASRCREALIYRGRDETLLEFIALMERLGFALAFRGTRSTIQAGPVHVFRQRNPHGASSDYHND